MSTEIGGSVLLGVGVVLLLSGAYRTVRGTGTKFPWIWIFGTLTAGIGVYGPAFMYPYKDFLDVLVRMENAQSVAGDTAVFERGVELANRMPMKYRKLADNRLNEAIQVARPEAKPSLTSLRTKRLKLDPKQGG